MFGRRVCVEYAVKVAASYVFEFSVFVWYYDEVTNIVTDSEILNPC